MFNPISSHRFLSLAFLSFLAFLLVIAVRLLFLQQLDATTSFTLDGELISIYTPDAALYGYYAQTLLAGEPHPHPFNRHLIETLLFYVVSYSPLNLDQALFILPALLASLVVLPVMGLAYSIMPPFFAMLAGVLAGIGYGFYSRSHLGYYDTDVLNVFFVYLIGWLLIRQHLRPSLHLGIAIAITLLLFQAWYHSAWPIALALVGFFIIIDFFRNRTPCYASWLMWLIVLMPFDWEYRLVALAILYASLQTGAYLKHRGFSYITHNKRPPKRIIWGVLAGLVALGIALLIDLQLVRYYLDRYITRPEFYQAGDYVFTYTMNTISESKFRDYPFITKLLSGHPIIFITSLIGVLWLFYKRPVFLILLPALFIGLLAFQFGARFHIYAVPLLIIGLSYIAAQLFYHGPGLVKLGVLGVMGWALYLSISLVMAINQSAKPFFTPLQIEALHTLKSQAAKGSYVVTWWDYGWPVWYYTGLNTLIDNGQHHQDNFIVSKLFLTHNPYLTFHLGHYFYNLFHQHQGREPAINLALAEQPDLPKLLNALAEKDVNWPTIHQAPDKFIFLPFQMVRAINTIAKFSDIDLTSGLPKNTGAFARLQLQNETPTMIYFTDGSAIDKKRREYQVGGQRVPIQTIYRTHSTQSRTVILGHAQGVSVIIHQGQFFIMNETFFHSMLIQLYFFERFNTALFEPIALNPQAKVLRFNPDIDAAKQQAR
ncbi:STT3 domain-containing protein [Thiomicrospira microaerophila]|uniref:STT3 domain-containing protein n=1 Tax=Thiomicrospira microaerophila TaxID=406020 RepID=UPI0005C927CC|nr:STT3 domain-containing protein [Thiomicrospira microaerophila]